MRIEDMTVGMSAEHSKVVSDADVARYAELIEDFQPVQLDEAFASKTRFGGRIAHGMLIAGYLSGVLATKELEDAIAKMAQALSPDLCSGSTIESIKQSIRQASDIMKDGTQDPAKECDGVSIGIGFEAVRVTLGSVAPKASPSPDPCP